MAGFLRGDGHDGREERGGKARSADHTDARDTTNRLNELRSGEWISQHGDVRNHARSPRQARLERRLGKGEARAAPGAELEAEMNWRGARGGALRDAVSDAGQVIPPAGLKRHGLVWIESQAGAADTGGEGRARGEVDALETDSKEFVAPVARSEVDVDALNRRHREDAIHSVERDGVAKTFDARPAIGYGVAQMMDNGVINGFIQ